MEIRRSQLEEVDEEVEGTMQGVEKCVSMGGQRLGELRRAAAMIEKKEEDGDM